MNIKVRILLFVKVFVRHMKFIVTDQGLVLFFLFLPLVYPVIYSLIYNPELVRDVDVVVVDNDRTAASRELTRKFDATQEARVIGYAASLSEARQAMNEHKCYAILEIPSGYDRTLGRGGSSPVILYCDMSLMLRYRSLLVGITNVQSALGTEIQAAEISSAIPDGASYVTGDLMPISSIAMGNIESGFDSFIMPGVIIFILHQCIILAVGMMGGTMRDRPQLYGFNPLLRRPPVLTAQLANALCCIIILAAPMAYIIHYVPLMFRFPMAGNIWEIMAFLMPMVIGAIFLGDCVQGLCRQREDIFIIWVVTSVLLLFLSGLTWPRSAMSPLWRFVGDLIPATWGMEGFIKMNANGATLSQVSHAYVMEWVLCIGYGILAYLVRRFVTLRTVRRSYLRLFPARPIANASPSEQ